MGWLPEAGRESWGWLPQGCWFAARPAGPELWGGFLASRLLSAACVCVVGHVNVRIALQPSNTFLSIEN